MAGEKAGSGRKRKLKVESLKLKVRRGEEKDDAETPSAQRFRGDREQNAETGMRPS